MRTFLELKNNMLNLVFIIHNQNQTFMLKIAEIVK